MYIYKWAHIYIYIYQTVLHIDKRDINGPCFLCWVTQAWLAVMIALALTWDDSFTRRWKVLEAHGFGDLPGTKYVGLQSTIYYPPLKTNIYPKKLWLEDDSFPFNMVPFQADIRSFSGNFLTSRSDRLIVGSHTESLFPNVLGSQLPLFPYNRGWSSTQ